MNIFVIDKQKKENICTIDFIPRRGERIVLNNRMNNIECTVICVLYHPNEHGVLVFVDVVENYYEKIIEDIKW